VRPKKAIKDSMDNFLLDLLLAKREPITSNIFGAILPRRGSCKTLRDPQSDGMTWRVFRI
jgi:hypothetical protein